MRALLGSEADELFEALKSPAASGMRVNTLKTAPHALAARSPWPLHPVPWCPSGFRLDREDRPGLHPYHRAGLYYLQDPSAMAPAEALAPHPSERILDLAAAPGGKATHLAALLGDRGLLVANDVHPGRGRELARNLERWGARSRAQTSAPPNVLAARWGGIFDGVLLDAPCSGEGMFRKTPEAVAGWSEASVLGCARRQGGLLEDAVRLLRPGGRLVYSTCTFAPEENEQVVADLLDRHPNLELEPLELPGSEPGRPDWTRGRHPLERTARLWPHKTEGDGHFVALLRNVGEPGDEVAVATTDALPTAPAAATALWSAFVSGTLRRDPFPGWKLTLRNDALRAVPEGVPDLTGIRVLDVGIRVGRIRKGRLEPGHALALCLRPDEIGARFELSPDDPRLALYLAGHPLDDPGEDGWLLVTVSGHPLGWGRRARGIVKNWYPKGLRTA